MHVASDDIPIRLIILLGDDGSPIGRRRTRGDNYLRNPASTQPADKGQDVRPHLVHEIPLKIFFAFVIDSSGRLPFRQGGG